MSRDRETRAVPTSDIAAAAMEFLLDATAEELGDALGSLGLSVSDLASDARPALAVDTPGTPRETRPVEKSHLIELRRGLGALLQLLRRQARLSVEDVATRARVPLDEIHRMETDFAYLPLPRTIYQLEHFFQLPERILAVLSGCVGTPSSEFTQEVVRFAAHAQKMPTLSREEQRLLNEFVRFLADRVKGE